MQTKLQYWLSSLAILLISAVGIGILQLNYLQRAQTVIAQNNINWELESETELALDLQKYLPTLGFGNILADWQFLQFIQYYGDTQARRITGYKLIPKYFENIVRIDPRFLKAYFILSTANSLFAARPEVTIKLTDEVINAIYPQFDPMAPAVWSYKGIDQLLFTEDIQGAKQSYEMAAKWSLERNDPSSAEIAARNLEMVQFLDKNPDSTLARIGAWSLILREAKERETQKRAIYEIEKLGGRFERDSFGRYNLIVPSNIK